MKVVVAAVGLCACTTLGPIPATTGVSAVPMERPGGEAQLGTVPGFYLSKSAQNQIGGAPIAQLSALFEPDRLIDLPGLLVGGRWFGQAGDAPIEPYIGYRKRLDQLSLAAIVFGTGARATDRLASYHATQLGLELAADAPVWSPLPWLAIHAQGSFTATRIAASGSYCVDTMGNAVDCDTTTPANNSMIEGHVNGYFPSGTLTLGFDFGRDYGGVFHGIRAAILGSAGEMPEMQNGLERSTEVYISLGLTLTVALGAK